MNDNIKKLFEILTQEATLRSLEKDFFEIRYGTGLGQIKLIAKLKYWPHDRLLDHAKCFLRERALISLASKGKLRFLDEQIKFYRISEEPISKELRGAYADCSGNYLEIQKIYAQYCTILQSLLSDKELDELKRDIAEEITRELTEGCLK